MKIRACCYFITATSVDDAVAQARASVAFFRDCLARLAALGVEVQMVRLATNAFEEYVGSAAPDAAAAAFARLDALCAEVSAALGGAVACILSVGDCGDAHLDQLPSLLRSTDMIFANLPLGARPRARGARAGPRSVAPDLARARRVARAVLALAATDGDGLISNGPLKGMPFAFRATVTARLAPGTTIHARPPWLRRESQWLTPQVSSDIRPHPNPITS